MVDSLIKTNFEKTEDKTEKENKIIKEGDLIELQRRKMCLSPKISQKKLNQEEDNIENMDQVNLSERNVENTQNINLSIRKSPTIELSQCEEGGMKKNSNPSNRNKMNNEAYLKLTFFSYVKALVKKKLGCKASINEQLFVNVKKKIIEKMDLIYILRTIQEFEKLKKDLNLPP